MEAGTEQDYSEFEMLLGEIPSVTSGNTYTEKSFPLKPSPCSEGYPSCSPCTFIDFYGAPQPGSPRTNAEYYGSMPSEKHNTTCLNTSQRKIDCQSPTRSAKSENSSLSGDQSLASALAQVTLEDGAANVQRNSHFANYKDSSECRFVPEGKCPNGLKEPYTSLDAPSIPITSPRAPSIGNATTLVHPTANGLENIDAYTTQERARFSELDIQEPNKKKNWPCQPLVTLSGILREQQQYPSVHSGAAPLAQNMHSPQVLPSNYVPTVDFSVPPYSQQYFLNAQPPGPYVQQQVGQSHISRQHMEEAHYYRLLQQQYCMQQFQGQVSDAHHPVQANLNTKTRPLIGTARQQHMTMSNLHQVEYHNEYRFWDNIS